MTLSKVSGLLSGISLGYLLLVAIPAQAQSSNTVHQLGILSSGDEQFTTGSYFDSYKIEGSAGQRISISLDSSDFNAFLGLLDSDGNLVTTNDDAAAGNPNSYISTTLPRNDTYTVIATSYSPQSGGDYRLALRNFSPPPARTASSGGSLENGWGSLVASPIGQMIMIGIVDSMFSGGGSSSTASDYGYYPDRQPGTSQPSYSSPTPAVGGDSFYGNGPQHGTSTAW